MSPNNNQIWFKIMERYKNSVMQLICIIGKYNVFRPQISPTDKKVSGSGFIIDINNGLVITNAHVVSNAISISGHLSRLGDYDISLKLISICREKDIALCKISESDIQLILKDFKPIDINMVFGDNMLLRETDDVITIGYPLGQRNIKFTTCVVSGFHANNDSDNNNNNHDEDNNFITEEEEPSYIQITTPLNGGNSEVILLIKMVK